MASLLTAIDIFGAAYTLKTNGKDKYRTKLGGLFTILCFVAIGFFSIIFGLDFYKKTNPAVSRNEFEHDKTQYMPLKSYEYMVRIDNKSIFNSPSYPYKPFGAYEHYIKKDDGRVETLCFTRAVISQCTETDAKTNPALKEFVLSDWYCIDRAKIISACKKQMKIDTYEPLIGGFTGDDSVGYIKIGVTNVVFDIDNNVVEQASLEEIKKMPSTFMDVVYPKAYYDSNKPKDALITKMAIDRFVLVSDSFRYEYRFMKQVKLFDDVGSLLEDIQVSDSVVIDNIQQMIFNNDLTQEGGKSFFIAVFFLNRNQLEHRRRFMKFQDVLAQVSAFVKGIVQIFLFFAVSYASYYMMSEMMEGYFGLEKARLDNQILSIDVNNAEKVDTIVNTSATNMKIKAAKEKELGQLGFLMYVLSCLCRRSSAAKSKEEFFRLAKDHIDRRLDVMSLLKLFDKFERLVEKTLSEEDQLELQRSHSVNNL